MGEYVLRTKNLSKKYGQYNALKNFNMNIKNGEIYGFVGKNGAGKTTLMKLVTGLSKVTAGEIELFGEYEKSKVIKNRKRIGVLIENPAFYEDMTAYENMELFRRQRGIPGKNSIIEKLNLVGLNGGDRKKLSEYSLGMKQKLGIAMALLGDPEFLILDEPINGLDPMGVAEIRAVFKRLNKEKGVTILISSHLLSELHQIATYYGIINEGEILEEISSEKLEEKCKKYLEIKVNNLEKAVIVIEEELKIKKYKVLPKGVIRIYEKLEILENISRIFSEENILIYEMGTKGEDLEQYFLNLIGGSKND